MNAASTNSAASTNPEHEGSPIGRGDMAASLTSTITSTTPSPVDPGGPAAEGVADTFSDRSISIVIYPHKTATTPTAHEITWSELVALLSDCRRTACTVATCPGKTCPHKDGRMWSPARIEGTRAKVNACVATALVLDVDDTSIDVLQRVIAALAADDVIGHVTSSHSHRDEDGRIRVRLVLRVSREILPAEHKRVWWAVVRHYAIPADHCSCPSWAYYLSSAPSDAPVIAESLAGSSSIDVDRMLAIEPQVEESEPADVTNWSTSTEILDERDVEKLHQLLRDLGPRQSGKSTTRAAIGMIFHDFGLSITDGRIYLASWNANNGDPHGAAELARQVERVSRLDHQMWRGWRVRLHEVEDYVAKIRARRPANENARPRSVIQISQTDIAGTVDDAARALAALGTVYVRARQLVRVVRDRSSPKWIKRPEGSPMISPIAPETLREILCSAAEWQSWSKTDEEWIPAVVPMWIVETLLARDQWDLPILEGITESPVFRADGSILDEPGYDSATRLIYDPCGVVFPGIAESPTRDDAVRAFGELLEPFSEFAFVAESDRAAVAAMILTMAGRAAIDGCVPGYMIDATTPGSGKGLLVDAATTIGIGRVAPKMSNTASEDEHRKRLLAIALAGDPVVVLDNVDGEIRSAVLAMAMTSGEITDRVLGVSKTATVSLKTIWVLTGNNIQLGGDLGRRFVPSYQDPKVEDPQYREFRRGDLIGYVTAERPRLYVAALAVLRAFVLAACPTHGKPRKGSFEQWDRLVRGAVLWAGGADPDAGSARIREVGDSDKDRLRSLLLAWQAKFGAVAATVGDAVRQAPGHAALADALTDYNGPGPLDAKRIGNAVKKDVGRIAGGLRLVRDGRGKTGVAYRVAG